MYNNVGHSYYQLALLFNDTKSSNQVQPQNVNKIINKIIMMTNEHCVVALC